MSVDPVLQAIADAAAVAWALHAQEALRDPSRVRYPPWPGPMPARRSGRREPLSSLVTSRVARDNDAAGIRDSP